MKSRYYAGGYGEYKQAIGYPGFPNLMLTGLMLGSIIGQVQSPMTGILFFGNMNTEQRALGHHYGGRTTQRYFFDLAPEERSHLVSTAARYHLMLYSKYGTMRP
jgi:hypothetical protein